MIYFSGLPRPCRYCEYRQAAGTAARKGSGHTPHCDDIASLGLAIIAPGIHQFAAFIQGVYLSEDILPAAEFIEIHISGGTQLIFPDTNSYDAVVSQGIRLMPATGKMQCRRLAREAKNKDVVAMVRDSLRSGNLSAKKPRRWRKKWQKQHSHRKAS